MNGTVAPVTITAKPQGPYLVEGEVVIRRLDGTILDPPPSKTPGITKLCACGRSDTKPFCDGSHNKAGSGEEGGRSGE